MVDRRGLLKAGFWGLTGLAISSWTGSSTEVDKPALPVQLSIQ
jgi:hypothetical protein